MMTSNVSSDMSGNTLHIAKTEENGTVTLSIEGRVNSITAVEFRKAVLAEVETAKAVVLDMTGVSYLASEGLRVFLLAAKTAKAKKCEMTLHNVRKNVLDVIKISGFSDFLTVR